MIVVGRFHFEGQASATSIHQVVRGHASSSSDLKSWQINGESHFKERVWKDKSRAGRESSEQELNTQVMCVQIHWLLYNIHVINMYVYGHILLFLSKQSLLNCTKIVSQWLVNFFTCLQNLIFQLDLKYLFGIMQQKYGMLFLVWNTVQILTDFCG